jgi:hypothetical protein
VPHRSPVYQQLRKYGTIHVAQTLLSVLVRLAKAEKINLLLVTVHAPPYFRRQKFTPPSS